MNHRAVILIISCLFNELYNSERKICTRYEFFGFCCSGINQTWTAVPAYCIELVGYEHIPVSQLFNAERFDKRLEALMAT